METQISLCINYSENDENTPIKTHCEGVECLVSYPKKVQWDKNKANKFVQSLDLSDVDSALRPLQLGGESNVNNFCLTFSNASTKAAHCTFKTTCMQLLIVNRMMYYNSNNIIINHFLVGYKASIVGYGKFISLFLNYFSCKTILTVTYVGLKF